LNELIAELDVNATGICWKKSMAQRQSLEEVNRLLRLAMGERRPIGAMYHNRRRVLCPHRLGWNKEGQRRVLCYQSGGASTSGLDPKGAQSNWRCLAVDKLSMVEIREDVWQTAENHSRPQTCIAQVEMDVEDQPKTRYQTGSQ
jgi:hypothetical protein